MEEAARCCSRQQHIASSLCYRKQSTLNDVLPEKKETAKSEQRLGITRESQLLTLSNTMHEMMYATSERLGTKRNEVCRGKRHRGLITLYNKLKIEIL